MIIKVNALVDPPVIRALYKASQAGVEIDLIIRGQCVLVPGLRGVSSRIRVRSIVGRFLEHSRIFYFENGGAPEIYLGSADWMPRNLYERVEVLFPLKDSEHRQRVCAEILDAYLADTRKARILGCDGKYSRPRAVRNGHGFSVQEHLMKLAMGVAGQNGKTVANHAGVIYTPAEAAAEPTGTTGDAAAQDSSNAAV